MTTALILIILAGLAAMRTLPIAQYPEIAPPVVTVSSTMAPPCRAVCAASL